MNTIYNLIKISLETENLLKSIIIIMITLIQIIFPGISFGQSQVCGVKDFSPEEMQQLTDEFNQWLQEGNKVIASVTVRIPVAFHIIRYSDGSADVSDGQINGQLNALNNGFENTNFRFVLHSIERINNTTWTTQADLGSQAEINMKQTLAVDPSHTLNFYTVASIPGWGYARFPWEFSESSYMHGVVVEYTAMPGGSDPNYNLGDTGVHEVGHYVGLWHTYENSCNYPGDEVEDTPYEAFQTSFCPSSKVSCDTEDPIHNFMDNSSDYCRYEFTFGQSNRMDEKMSYFRPSIYPIEVSVDQKREDGSRLSGTYIGRWEGSSFTNNQITINHLTFPFTIGINEILRGDQNLVTNPYDEKYYQWFIETIPQSNVENHHTFPFDGSFSFLVSQFKKTYSNVTLKNEFPEVPTLNPTNDVIQFKDPWFIDYPDPDYGSNRRNRGMQQTGNDALIFRERFSPFYPNFTDIYEYGEKYNGVFLNQPIVSGQPYYSVRSISPQDVNLGGQIGTRGFYFQNWTYDANKITLQSPTSNESAVVFKSTSDAMLSANFKGTGLSNEQNGYSPSNQRKFVKNIYDNYSHHVYSSLGHIWYEISTDGGTTWLIANDGNYIDNGEAKLSVIDESGYYYYDPSALIVYQEKNGNNYKIKLKRFYDGVQTDEDEIYSSSQSYTINANPVVAYSKNILEDYRFFVVFQSSEGLRYQYGYVHLGQINWYESGMIYGTDLNSVNPTIAARKNTGGQGDFYLAWQHNNNQIYYKKIHYVDGEITDDPAPILYSYNDGFTYNWLPSISIVYGPPYYPLISWVGHNGALEKITRKIGDVDGTAQQSKIVVKRGTTGNFFIAGNNVNNVNNNSTSESAENSVIVWSESMPAVSKWVRRTGTTYSTTANLSNSGIENQASNGADLENIKAMVINTAGSPYFFKQATTNFCFNRDMQKIVATEDELTFGRTGIVGKGDVQFVFNVGDIVLADTNVQFIPKPDTLLYTNTDELNQDTRSLTIHLYNQSQLFFTDYYYTVNSEIADSVLSDNDAVSFRVELVNANTNAVVGTFDEITYTKNNLEEHDNINYQVDCSDIEEGDYFLRLVTTVVGDASYNLANVQNDDPELEKRIYNQVTFKGNEIPNVYELFQNYPNPFNPATTIKYQIPQDGLVILKIYDILGEEVETLVNEEKISGRYEVNFNASSLASGVYIYRIQVNDFVNVKKMILMK